MKPFWRYGAAGKERLVVKAFEAVKASISSTDEEEAFLAVHRWLMDKGYLDGTDKKKSQKFKDPEFFWSKKNYDKYKALIKALQNQKFYEETEAETREYKRAMKEAKQAEIDAATEQFYRQWPEYDKRRIPCEMADTWEEEMAGSFGFWALWASAVCLGGMMVLGGKEK